MKTGRPRLYETDAARQAAYNERKRERLKKIRETRQKRADYEGTITADMTKRLSRYVASELLKEALQHRWRIHPSPSATDKDEADLRAEMDTLVYDLKWCHDTLS